MGWLCRECLLIFHVEMVIVWLIFFFFPIQGEMQLATTIALIASPLVTFPPFQVERLAHAYVQLLEQHRLFMFAAYIRRFSGIPSLEITPQDEGLTHTFFCERCGKSTGNLEDIEVKGKIFWWCKKCRTGARSCAIWYVQKQVILFFAKMSPLAVER